MVLTPRPYPACPLPRAPWPSPSPPSPHIPACACDHACDYACDYAYPSVCCLLEGARAIRCCKEDVAVHRLHRRDRCHRLFPTAPRQLCLEDDPQPGTLRCTSWYDMVNDTGRAGGHGTVWYVTLSICRFHSPRPTRPAKSPAIAPKDGDAFSFLLFAIVAIRCFFLISSSTPV